MKIRGLKRRNFFPEVPEVEKFLTKDKQLKGVTSQVILSIPDKSRLRYVTHATQTPVANPIKAMKPPLLRPVFNHKNRSSIDNQLNTQDRTQYVTSVQAEQASRTPIPRPPLPPFYDRQRHYYNPQVGGRGRRSIQSLDAAANNPDEILPTFITPNGKHTQSLINVHCRRRVYQSFRTAEQLHSIDPA